MHDDHVAVAEIRRPPNNFFDADLIASLADAYEWADAKAGARAIVLCSAGRLAERVAEAMAAELAEQDRLRRTADFAEGVRASAERRQPRFEGR